ncbi:MAG: tetratricopeptide repeat protein [Methanoregulaceae archaeon]|nr:MAG: tetratricopeptide repeat protein [Methanoregulaceae archaeon]
MGKGQELADLNRFNDALAAYNRALRVNPENVVTWNLSGDAFFHLDGYEEAVVAYDRVIRLEPDHVYAWQRKGDWIGTRRW